MKAIILAGGRGTRLKPYTTIFPKPLMPINDKPILEIIACQLKKSGFDEMIFAVGHLSELIKAFFGDGSKFGIEIRYSTEDKPLGTVGGLSLLRDELNESFLVMNGDILSTLNFQDLVNYHKESGAIATIAVTRREVYIDFGIIETNLDNSIIKFTEKPSINYLVSMGIYIFEPNVMKYIKLNEYLDIPDLIKKLIIEGEIVKGYVHNGYWLDIGRPEDYEHANHEHEEIYSKLGIGDE